MAHGAVCGVHAASGLWRWQRPGTSNHPVQQAGAPHGPRGAVVQGDLPGPIDPKAVAPFTWYVGSQLWGDGVAANNYATPWDTIATGAGQHEVRAVIATTGTPVEVRRTTTVALTPRPVILVDGPEPLSGIVTLRLETDLDSRVTWNVNWVYPGGSPGSTYLGSGDPADKHAIRWDTTALPNGLVTVLPRNTASPPGWRGAPLFAPSPSPTPFTA